MTYGPGCAARSGSQASPATGPTKVARPSTPGPQTWGRGNGRVVAGPRIGRDDERPVGRLRERGSRGRSQAASDRSDSMTRAVKRVGHEDEGFP